MLNVIIFSQILLVLCLRISGGDNCASERRRPLSLATAVLAKKSFSCHANLHGMPLNSFHKDDLRYYKVFFNNEKLGMQYKIATLQYREHWNRNYVHYRYTKEEVGRFPVIFSTNSSRKRLDFQDKPITFTKSSGTCRFSSQRLCRVFFRKRLKRGAELTLQNGAQQNPQITFQSVIDYEWIRIYINLPLIYPTQFRFNNVKS